MLNRIIQWIREVFAKMLKLDNLKQAIGFDVAINSQMVSALNLWSLIYTNKAPWLNKDVHSTNLGASIASEVARAVTIELKAEITGSPRADYLTEQFKQVLSSARVNAEFAAAKGGLVFKPYVRGNKIVIDFVQADSMYPIAFDSNGNMTGAVFADQRTKGNQIYTRLETHMLMDTNYRITNVAYVSSTVGTLGSPVNLNMVAEWADLTPEAVIVNVERPLFAYFKMPGANNIDSTSPLGMSIFSRATQAGSNGKSLLQEADEIWSNFLWELESGKRALYIDKLALTKDANGLPTLPLQNMFRLVDMQSKVDGKGFFEDWTPTIRQADLLASLDNVLRRIEFVCGLSYGVISNPQSVALTATEIKNSQQRYYSTVTDTQKSLANAFDNLLYAMDVYATLYSLAPNGDYQAVYSFDDSIVSDRDTAFVQDSQAVSMQVMSKVEFRMRNYGESEEVAKQKIQMVADEQSGVNFFANSNLNVGA